MTSAGLLWHMKKAMSSAGWTSVSSSDPRIVQPVRVHRWFLDRGSRTLRLCLRCGATVRGLRRPPPSFTSDPGPTFRSPSGTPWRDPCPDVMGDVHDS